MTRLIAVCLLCLLPLRVAAHENCTTNLALWGTFLAVGEQTWERREVIPLTDEDVILAIEFGPLKGEYAKVWLFARYHGRCMIEAVSLGSYAYLRASGKEHYHLDLYRPDSHATLGFYDAKPGYDEIRQIAMDTLK